MRFPRINAATKTIHAILGRQNKGLRVKLLIGHPEIEEKHSKIWRIFASTDGATIRIAKDLENLPEPYLWGIILHEYGHIVAIRMGLSDHQRPPLKGVPHIKQPAEGEADCAISRTLGVSLLFDAFLQLECLSDRDIRKLKNA